MGAVIRRWIRAVALLALLAALLAACTAPRPAELAPRTRAVADSLDRMIPILLDSLRVPGAAIALIEGGNVVRTVGYGFADLERRTPVTEETVFQVASISKTVAAWGVMRLVELERLELDAPAIRYLARWHLPPPDSPGIDLGDVTIRRLLSHTAGLSLSGYPGFDPDSGALPTIEESLSGKTNGAGDVRVAFRPGTRWQYSGGGYTLLQMVIEEGAGESFQAFMERTILAPLGMRSSSYDWERPLRARTAGAYDQNLRRLPNYRFTALAAAGLYTTVKDLAHFVAAGMPGPRGAPAGRHVLLPETVALMHEPAPNATTPFGAYGLGHVVDTLSTGRRYVSHTGGNRGWRSIFLAVPETGDGLVVLTNGNAGAALYDRVVCAWLRVAANATRNGCMGPAR